jgi:hypothetical protein
VHSEDDTGHKITKHTGTNGVDFVDVITLDDVMTNVDIFAMKIDVEGFESRVFNGFRKVSFTLQIIVLQLVRACLPACLSVCLYVQDEPPTIYLYCYIASRIHPAHSHSHSHVYSSCSQPHCIASSLHPPISHLDYGQLPSKVHPHGVLAPT